MIITSGSSGMFFGTSTPLSFAAPQLKNLDVYYTRSPDSPCGSSVCLNWFPISGASISEYRVYRSIVGFMGTLAPIATLNGKTLEVSINLGPTQTVLFNDVTPVVDRINSMVIGAKAYPSELDNTKFLFYVDGGSEPGVVQVIGGTALSDLGVLAGTYSKESHDTLVATIPAQPSDDTIGVEWCDPDGSLYASYAVSTVDLSNVESGKTDYQMPTQTTGKVCMVYGCISDISGVRIPDTVVTAKILQYPQSVVAPTYVNKNEVSVVANSQGRFEIALLQNALVDISIEDAYYRRTVRIPAQSRAAITDLPIDRDYRCPLEIY